MSYKMINVFVFHTGSSDPSIVFKNKILNSKKDHSTSTEVLFENNEWKCRGIFREGYISLCDFHKINFSTVFRILREIKPI